MHIDDVMIAALVACVCIAALGVARRWVRWCRARVVEPACAACRAPVREVPSLRCPACGADLREVGILTPRLRASQPTTLAERLAALTCVSLVLLVAGSLVLNQVPGLSVVTRTRRHVLRSEAGMFDRLAVEAVTRDDRGGARKQRMSVGVQGAAFRCSAIELSGSDQLMWSYVGADQAVVRGTDDLTAGDIAKWLSRGGIHADSPAKEAECAEIAALVADLRQHPDSANVALMHMRNISRHQSESVEPLRWLRIASMAIPACVWVVGVVLLVRSARRKSRVQ